MGRPKKITEIFYEENEDEVQIRSWNKNFNKAILKLRAEEPSAVWIGDEDEAPAFLWAAVKRPNITWHLMKSPDEEVRRRKSDSGKIHSDNLKKKEG